MAMDLEENSTGGALQNLGFLLGISDEDVEYFNSYSINETIVKGLKNNNNNPCNSGAPSDSSGRESSICELFQLDIVKFKDLYEPIHGHLSLYVCIIGCIFNILNFFVLTHKDMRTNPINMILTGIAVADFLNLLEYIPFNVHMYLLDPEKRSQDEMFSTSWGYFLLFHMNFSIFIHTVSIWLTLSLAIWRFIMIKFPAMSVSLCTVEKCKVVLGLGYVIPIFLTIPNYFEFHVASVPNLDEDTGLCQTLYYVKYRDDDEDEQKFFQLNLWLYGFMLKLVPCLVLTVFTASLIRAMYQAEEHNRKLKLRTERRETVASSEYNNVHIRNRHKHTDRTTKLLIVILIMFLVAEFPLGILGMLSAILGPKFFDSCYHPLGEILEIIVLFNCSTNFLIYCLMSSQFRITGKKILGMKKKVVCNRRMSSIKLEKFQDIKFANGDRTLTTTQVPPQMTLSATIPTEEATML